jgi:hypothetical protein
LGLRLPLRPLLLLRRRNPLLDIKVARVGILPTARLRTVVLNPIPYPSLLGLLKNNPLQHPLKLINVLIALILKIPPIPTSKLDAIPILLLKNPITIVLVRRLSCIAVCTKERRTKWAGIRSNPRLAPIIIPRLVNLQTTTQVHTRVIPMDHATLMIINKHPHRRIVYRQFECKNVG